MNESLSSNGKTPLLAEALSSGGELKDVTGKAKWTDDMKVEIGGEVYPVVLDEYVTEGMLVLVGGIIYADCD
jgi:hypothetical protein